MSIKLCGKNSFWEDDTMRIVFSDKKTFDLDGIYSCQNDRIWTVHREETNRRGRKEQLGKLAEKVKVWLAVCSEGVPLLILFEKGTLDHHRYIKEVLSVALRYGSGKVENNWTFQQDNRPPHTHQETQEWCYQYLTSFIDKDTCPANSPNLNPRDYCIWDESAQAIKWDKVISKSSLISELKCDVKKNRLDVIREGCSVWTNRLYRMTQNDENYLRE